MALIDRMRRFLAGRRTAYVQTFRGPSADVVLADLAKFCRARESTFHPDARVHALAEGRREVFLRIQNHLQLSDDQLLDLYGRGANPTQAETE